MKEYLENRIAELKKADAEFCELRWDMNRPDFERKLYRDQSNEVTFARQELQRALKFLESQPLPPVPPFIH